MELQSQEQRLEQVLPNLPEQEQAELVQPVEWEEVQEWELNLILSLEWAVWEEPAWEEQVAWEECQCSLVWLLEEVHLEWEVWVEQTWIHK